MKNIIKELLPYVLILGGVILIRTFIVTPVIVSGDSMKPNLHNGELLLERKIGYNSTNIKRFDIVVIKEGKEEIIKRIIGLPGEHISYKNNKDMTNYSIEVHSLKSDSKYFGFTRLAELSLNHELKSKENDIEYVNNNFIELENEFKNVCNIVNNYLNNIK